MSSAKCCSFRFGLNVLTWRIFYIAKMHNTVNIIILYMRNGAHLFKASARWIFTIIIIIVIVTIAIIIFIMTITIIIIILLSLSVALSLLS